MPPRTDRPRPSDALLLAGLVAGKTVGQAAADACVSERTALRRLQDPDFRARLNALQADTIGRAVAQLTAAATGAVDVLVDLLSADKPDVVRLRAATSILDQLVKLRTMSELEARIAALERLSSATPERRWRTP